MGYLCIHKLTEVAMIEYIERLLQGVEVEWKTLGEVADYIRGCLLYTSPSPRDAHESRMPSSA